VSVSPGVPASPAVAVSPAVSPGVPASPAVVSSPSASTPTPLPPPTVPSPTAGAPATPTPGTEVKTAWVGNTDGAGVYLRNSPHDGDRGDVIADGTMLTVTGEEVEGDGLRWYPVKLDDGSAGYVPVDYTTMTAPSAPPTEPQGDPK
jgi:hypothetical protein